MQTVKVGPEFGGGFLRADPVDGLFCLNPSNGQVKVMSVDIVVLLKHSTTDVWVWNDVMLQDLVSISDAHQQVAGEND